jgi:hypothetical protein
MSQRNRLNLKDLVGLRKPLIQTPVSEREAGAAPAKEAEAAHFEERQPIEVPSEVPPTVPPKILEQRREKRRLVAQSFKLPAELDQRWSELAAYNQITKTGILLEALETFLDRLPHPPPKASR